MSIYLLCSLRGHKRPETRDAILVEAQRILVAEYGRALPGLGLRQLDLVAAGPAFVDLTDIKGMHLGQVFRARHVIDLWWRVKDRAFQPGRGYEEWVWQSAREFLRISGEGGRAWRVMLG